MLTPVINFLNTMNGNLKMERHFQDDPEFAITLDSVDPLRGFRSRFHLRNGEINLCGNSLGLASIDAEKTLLECVEKWKELGVSIWGWEGSKYYLYSNHLAELMAPLIGVESEEIALTGSTTSNIHQTISTLYKPNGSRYKILVDDINFPTDRYAVDSVVRLKGLDPKTAVKVVHCDGRFIDEDHIIDSMTDDVAIALLPVVYYKTSHVLDIKRISEAANERGIIIGFDLCHAIGILDLNLSSLDVDFAIWCTYKYLNGGPGSTAALYMNRKHFHLLPGLAGWFGNRKETQFLLRQEFDHQRSASGLQIGTPCLFSMAALEGSLKMFAEAGLKNIRQKSLHITEYFMYLIDEKLGHYGFAIGNPREDKKRGGHVCLQHQEAYRITLALKERGVVPDYRPPNVIRLCPTALYTSYAEVYKVVEMLMDIAKNHSYKTYSTEKQLVV